MERAKLQKSVLCLLLLVVRDCRQLEAGESLHGLTLNDPLVFLELKAQAPRGLLQDPGGPAMYTPGDARQPLYLCAEGECWDYGSLGDSVLSPDAELYVASLCRCRTRQTSSSRWEMNSS